MHHLSIIDETQIFGHDSKFHSFVNAEKLHEAYMELLLRSIMLTCIMIREEGIKYTNH